ncbi:MAG TPA: response regulator [Opitutaceae bacterium]|nr:response regulator [Opitutaceae bacterium]
MQSHASAPFLIAEDNPDDMFQFTRLLKSTGATNSLHHALTSKEAIELLERVTGRGALVACPAAAFVDVRLNGGDGFDVLAWIRKHRAFDALPVIMLADTDDPREIARSTKLGAQCHLIKYPSKAIFARILGEVPRFQEGRIARCFDLPNNLIRPSHERR